MSNTCFGEHHSLRNLNQGQTFNKTPSSLGLHNMCIHTKGKTNYEAWEMEEYYIHWNKLHKIEPNLGALGLAN